MTNPRKDVVRGSTSPECTLLCFDEEPILKQSLEYKVVLMDRF